MQLRSPAAALNGHTPRVLVVNDDPLLREEVVRRLVPRGVAAVGSSRELAEVRGRFDLVVLCAPRSCDVDDVVRQVDAALAFAGRDDGGGVVEGPNDLQLFPRSRHVLVNGQAVSLPPKSFEVLHLLLDRRNEVLSADDVALAVWGHPTFGSPNFVEAQISRLRSRLAIAGATGVIETVPRVGYVIR